MFLMLFYSRCDFAMECFCFRLISDNDRTKTRLNVNKLKGRKYARKDRRNAYVWRN